MGSEFVKISNARKTIIEENELKKETGKAWKENVVVDGRLITGQNPASAFKVAEKVIERLREGEE